MVALRSTLDWPSTLIFLDIKAKFKFIDAFLDANFYYIHDLIAGENTCPSGINEAKNIVCPNDLPHIRYHRCVSDCVIYRSEHADLEEYHVERGWCNFTFDVVMMNTMNWRKNIASTWTRKLVQAWIGEIWTFEAELVHMPNGWVLIDKVDDCCTKFLFLWWRIYLHKNDGIFGKRVKNIEYLAPFLWSFVDSILMITRKGTKMLH
jgi:hypothetical protein